VHGGGKAGGVVGPELVYGVNVVEECLNSEVECIVHIRSQVSILCARYVEVETRLRNIKLGFSFLSIGLGNMPISAEMASTSYLNQFRGFS
jgi:hypothetical protein